MKKETFNLQSDKLIRHIPEHIGWPIITDRETEKKTDLLFYIFSIFAEYFKMSAKQQQQTQIIIPVKELVLS